MRVGVLGGGQLGQMLALAGIPLGLRFRFLDPSPDAPAAAAGELVVGSFDDEAALDRFAAGLDLVTFEFENVPAAAAARLAARLPLFPPARALALGQDRLAEKKLLDECGFPVPRHAPVDSAQSLREALRIVGLPAVLKTRYGGYDGKGQVVIRAESEVDSAMATLAGRPLLIEQFVPFRRELSILAVRGRAGETAYYPPVENRHRDGILRLSRAPADADREAWGRARQRARSLLERLDYVGVIAIELFDFGGEFLANELAPRVHNSGHWTIEGAETSQFENHCRAVAGLPLGDTAPVGVSAMVNLIGSHTPAPELAAIPGAHLHLYGKEPRPGRKLGHVTLRSADEAALRPRLAQLLNLAGEPLEP